MKLNAPRWALECSVNSRGWRERLRALRWLALIDGCRRRRGGGEEVRESETDTQRGSEESGEDTEDLSASDLWCHCGGCTRMCLTLLLWNLIASRREGGNQANKTHRGQSGSPNTMTNQTWRLTHSVCFIAKFGGSVQNWVANTPLLS